MFGLLKLIPGAGINDYMSVQRGFMLTHLPAMYMMNIYHTFDPDEYQNDSVRINI